MKLDNAPAMVNIVAITFLLILGMYLFINSDHGGETEKIGTVLMVMGAVLLGVQIPYLFKVAWKPQIEKIHEKNRNKTITSLLVDIYRLDDWVGRSIMILTKQSGFDRADQKSYRVTGVEGSRLTHYLKQLRSMNTNIRDNEKFLLQYLDMDEYLTIATYVHNSANFFLIMGDETGKTDGTIPVFCLPQYMHVRIEYSTKLTKLFSKQLKPEFIKEWNNFLSGYTSPY